MENVGDFVWVSDGVEDAHWTRALGTGRGCSSTLSDEQLEPERVERLGEVALTYICCPTCGSCGGNPEARGVARLDEDHMNMPLPIVIYACSDPG